MAYTRATVPLHYVERRGYITITEEGMAFDEFYETITTLTLGWTVKTAKFLVDTIKLPRASSRERFTLHTGEQSNPLRYDDCMVTFGANTRPTTSTFNTASKNTSGSTKAR
jgi:hypothetical protein